MADMPRARVKSVDRREFADPGLSLRYRATARGGSGRQGAPRRSEAGSISCKGRMSERRYEDDEQDPPLSAAA